MGTWPVQGAWLAAAGRGGLPGAARRGGPLVGGEAQRVRAAAGVRGVLGVRRAHRAHCRPLCTLTPEKVRNAQQCKSSTAFGNARRLPKHAAVVAFPCNLCLGFPITHAEYT